MANAKPMKRRRKLVVAATLLLGFCPAAGFHLNAQYKNVLDELESFLAKDVENMETLAEMYRIGAFTHDAPAAWSRAPIYNVSTNTSEFMQMRTRLKDLFYAQVKSSSSTLTTWLGVGFYDGSSVWIWPKDRWSGSAPGIYYGVETSGELYEHTWGYERTRCACLDASAYESSLARNLSTVASKPCEGNHTTIECLKLYWVDNNAEPITPEVDYALYNEGSYNYYAQYHPPTEAWFIDAKHQGSHWANYLYEWLGDIHIVAHVAVYDVRGDFIGSTQLATDLAQVEAWLRNEVRQVSQSDVTVYVMEKKTKELVMSTVTGAAVSPQVKATNCADTTIAGSSKMLLGLLESDSDHSNSTRLPALYNGYQMEWEERDEIGGLQILNTSWVFVFLTPIEAPSGTYFNEQSMSTVDCPAGTFSNGGEGLNTPTSCDPCLPGRYASRIHSEACEECPAQEFQSSNGSAFCFRCDRSHGIEYTSQAGATSCDFCVDGYYWENRTSTSWSIGGGGGNVVLSGQCIQCPDVGTATECPEGTLLETIIILKGYYRHSVLSKTVAPCERGPAGGKECIGTKASDSNATSGTGLCDQGYTSALCASCDTGYYRDYISKECVHCSEQDGLSPSTIVTVVAVCCVVLFIFFQWFIETRCVQETVERTLSGSFRTSSRMLLSTPSRVSKHVSDAKHSRKDAFSGCARCMAALSKRWTQIKNWWRKALTHENENFGTLADNFTTLFITWQIISQMISLHNLRGGSPMPSPFKFFTDIIDVTGLDFLTIFHVECFITNKSTPYIDKMLISSIVPLGASFIYSILYAWLSRQPLPENEDERRPVGQAMTNARLKRDWFYLQTLKVLNMIQFYTIPACVMIYAKAFVCTPVDDGDEISFMATSMDVPCGKHARHLNDDREELTKQVALVLLILVPGLMFANFAFALLPIRELIMDRFKKSGVSPLIDFIVRKWKPTLYWFWFVEMIRRIVATSGLVFFENRRLGIVFAILVNVLFMSAFAEYDPFWSASTNMVQLLCNILIVCCALALLLMDCADVLDMKTGPGSELEVGMSTILIIVSGLSFLVALHPFALIDGDVLRYTSSSFFGNSVFFESISDADESTPSFVDKLSKALQKQGTIYDLGIAEESDESDDDNERDGAVNSVATGTSSTKGNVSPPKSSSGSSEDRKHETASIATSKVAPLPIHEEGGSVATGRVNLPPLSAQGTAAVGGSTTAAGSKSAISKGAMTLEGIEDGAAIEGPQIEVGTRVRLRLLASRHSELNGQFGKVVRAYEGNRYAVQLATGAPKKIHAKNLEPIDTMTKERRVSGLKAKPDATDRKMSRRESRSHDLEQRRRIHELVLTNQRLEQKAEKARRSTVGPSL